MAIEQAAATEQGAHFGQYVEQMRAAWDAAGDDARPAQGQALLETLLRETPADEPWVAGLLGEEPPARELYRDPTHGFIQMGHFHRPGHGNAPHDHGPCWVLYGVYRGEIEITTYRRLDDGSVPGQAQLEVKDVVRVKPGMVRPYLPGEIHSTRAIDPDGSLVMRFLSADLDPVERYRYKLETGQVVRV
jgi:predicted metal-dependent enzyme (double-stranded beta helix superfamily)